MILDDDTRRFIDAQRVARLATVDEHRRPHLVPVCFALDPGRDVVYTPVDEKPKSGDARSLRRLRNIAANRHVQLLLDVYDDADWSRLRWMQLRGPARVIDRGEEHTQAIALLRARYAQYGGMALEQRPVIAVDVERVVWWSASGGDA